MADFQIIRRTPRKNMIAEAARSAQDTLWKNREYERQQEADSLARAKFEAEYGGPVPEGFVRAGGTLKEDPTYVSPKDQADIDYKRSRAGMDEMLTPGQRLAKDKATSKIYETYEMNKAKQSQLDKAIEGSQDIPRGFLGKVRVNAAKSLPALKGLLKVTDKQIQDAQELKIALTMGTLAETANTKGAISDQEMALFKEAAANDDFNSPAIQPVLEKIKNYMDAENAGAFGAYKRSYGEDPSEWFGSVDLPKRKSKYKIIQVQ